MSWEKPILTDSGGFQVFSLSKLRRITDKGVDFKSHLDGSPVFLGPRESFEIQKNLGSDIAMVLDVCPSQAADREECEEAVRRTLLWAGKSRELAEESGFLGEGRQLFGITQGGRFPELRETCTDRLVEMDFPGYAIGGISVGETEDEMLRQVAHNAPLLPANKPRYVMGVGTPPQLLKMIGMGIDMFDCVMPTRAARHGTAYTPTGRLNMKNEQWKQDASPLVEGMDNYCCRNFSRAYLRHLVISNEPLAGMLLTLHNLHFYLDLMDQARAHIEAGDFSEWADAWIRRFSGEDACVG
jgi:queuine tRNA-ribosyltransferase